MFSRVCRNKLIRLYFPKCQLTTGDNPIESNQRIQRPEWVFECADHVPRDYLQLSLETWN